MEKLNFDELGKKSHEEDDFSPEEIFKKREINLKAAPKVSPIAISIGTDENNKPLIFGTYGNISLIKGEEKARKSFLKSLLEANCFDGNSNNYTNSIVIKCHNLGDRYVVSLDSEQDEFYAWLNANRVKTMCGFIPDNYKYYYLRGETISNRLKYIEWLLFKSPLKDKIGILVIDGYVDLVHDFNNQIECIELVSKLMKYSEMANCHITGVLHLNPDTTKGRGALGTILQQKCETVTIIKDEGDYSKVYCQRGRGKKFDDFYLSIDEKYMPILIDTPNFNKETTSKNKPFPEK